MPRESESLGDQSGRSADDAGDSDRDIVVAVRAGDVAAFESLVRRYRGKLLKTAYSRLGSSAAAEDAVQNTFLAAFRSLETYDSRYSFRGWLWTILINQCRSDYRKSKREEDVTQSLSGPTALTELADETENGAPDDRLIQSEQLQSVFHHLRQLPPEQATAIQLRFFGEMKYDEMAATMQCGLTTAKNRVRVGLERLASQIKGGKAE